MRRVVFASLVAGLVCAQAGAAIAIASRKLESCKAVTAELTTSGARASAHAFDAARDLRRFAPQMFRQEIIANADDRTSNMSVARFVGRDNYIAFGIEPKRAIIEVG